MFVATTILAVVVAGGFLMAGTGKVLGQPAMSEIRDRLGLVDGMWKLIGGLEILGAAGVLAGLHQDLPVIGVLAGVGLVLLTIGAAAYHQNAGDAMADWLPSVVMGSVTIIYIILRVGSA